MNSKKKKIVNVIQMFLLVLMMLQGFFITYAVIWHEIGLPLTDWSFWLLYALACLSEYGYYRWIRGGDEE